MVKEHTYKRLDGPDYAGQIRVMHKQIRALQKNVEELNAAVEDIFRFSLKKVSYMAEDDGCDEECNCDACEYERCECGDEPEEVEETRREPVIVKVTRKVRYS